MSRPSKNPSAEHATLSAFFLVGVTACGKSAVAQFLAEREGYDVLSADSMLVYEGMDIGTAKPSRDERARVNYHGIDVVAPDRPFSVWDFREYAIGVLRAGAEAGRRTIVVGGSGLYVKSLTAGLRAAPGADACARTRLDDLCRREGVGALQAELEEKHGDMYRALPDKSNPRRLIRALELAESGVTRPAATWNGAQSVPMAGLILPRKALDSRIRERVAGMYARGFRGEVEGLLRKHGRFSDSAAQAIGYAEALDLLAGRCSAEDAVERTVIRTRRLAKRQQTWFNHQANVVWLECVPGEPVDRTAERVAAHWERHGPVPVAV